MHVGQRLRLRRNATGMSQERLGEAIGVSFQMVQKYERGDCRVGASRLMKISQALGVPVAFFFEGFNGAPALAMVAEDRRALDDGLLKSRESVDLLKNYYNLPVNLRQQILEMVKSMADQPRPAKAKGARESA